MGGVRRQARHGRRHRPDAGAPRHAPPGARPARWAAADCGSVTAEFAVVLPAVVAVALLLVGLTRTVAVSMRCQDAAAAVVRELVVTGGQTDAAAVARDVAGADASVAVRRAQDRVTVNVTCPVLPGPLGVLPAQVSGEAVGVAP